MAEQRPLIYEGIDLSDTTNNTPALPSLGFTSSSHHLGFHASPPSSPSAFSRPNYQRLGSDATAIERTTPPTVIEEEEEDIADGGRHRDSSGLGIAGAPAAPPAINRRVSIPRRPVPYSARSSTIRSPSIKSPIVKSPETLSPPNTGDLLGRFPKDSPYNTPDLSRERFSPNDDPGDYEDFRGKVINRQPTTDSVNNDYQNFLHSTDTARLSRGAPSLKSAYEHDFKPTHECPTARDFYTSRYTWLSISILLLCLFSTVFSGIFLGLALKGPRYGRMITSHGSFKPADAIVLTSVIAKLIELSFVTSFVAFLGQVLSRRAFMKEHGRGVTLSELSMWRWVVQPGTLITHFETAKYAGLSFLGILSLLSAVLATLYGSAATALVQPMLKDGFWDSRLMVGRVKTTWANVKYVSSICETPVRTDDEYAGSTCLQIEHAGQGYHNYQRYLADWNKAAKHGNGTSDQKRRPPGFGLLYENTTVTAQWINVINTTEASKKFGRAINNVSLAMPHAGVFQAARDQRNDILQPEELNSEGTYSLRASVPSPVMNVLCANMNEDELKPIVYDEWNDSEVVNGTTWPTLWGNATTTNKTAVDEVFGWTKQDKEKMLDYPPVFAKLPRPFNTIMNHTNAFWGRDSIYLLGQGGKDSGSNLTGVYVLCKIHVSLTPDCSTRYNATGSGGTMESLCEDPRDKFAYIKSYTNASESVPIQDWKDIGFDWSNSLSLNTGIVDADASNSRLLTQLILQPKNPDPENLDVDLSPALPSVGEALAVMSGCTLLKSMLDAPYVMFWNYTLPMLDEYQSQYFNASLKAQQYASGGVDNASKGWIIILFLVFLMNIFVLIYFVFHRGLVTDFSEPPNLFALAVNSPPSHLLAGSCGGGPEGKQYMVNWFVNAEGDHLYVEPGEKPVHSHDAHTHTHTHTHQHTQNSHLKSPNVHVHPPSFDGHVREVTPDNNPNSGPGFGFVGAVTDGFHKLRERGLHFGRKQDQRRLRPASVVASDLELEDAHTRTQRQYAKLSKRRSML